MRFAIGLCLLAALAIPAASQSSPSATLQGRVLLPGGRRSPAGLRLRLEQGGKTLQDQLSRDGAFRFDNLAPGSYTLVMEAPGYPAAVTPVDVSGNRSLQLELDPVSATAAENPVIASVSDYQVPAAALRQLQQAEKKLRSGDCPGALKRLGKTLETYPSYAAAHTDSGICYARLNQPDRAEDELRRAIDLTASVYPALNLANLYLQQGRTDDAAQLLSEAIQRSPAESDGYYTLALVRFGQNRLPEAEQLALTACARPVHSAEAHLLLARIYQREKRSDNRRIRHELQLYLDEAPPGPVRDQIHRMMATGKFADSPSAAVAPATNSSASR